MPTLTLTHIPRTQSETRSLVDSLAHALDLHLDTPVTVRNTWPSPRLDLTCDLARLRAAARLYLDPIGIDWEVTA
jgi:hypothetical protein